MANVKISDLTAYTDPVATDVLPIVDLVNDQTKKVKVEDLLKRFGAGTEALPSFAFTGDLDTGIYSPGANQFAVSTGGTQRLLIDASGNTTIQGDLTVNGTTTTIESTTLSIDDKNIELGTVSTPSDTTADGGGITLKGATDKTLTWVDSTDCWTFNQSLDLPAGSASAPALILNGDVNSGLFQSAVDEISVSTGGTQRVVVDSSGNVGIGNTAPGAKLQIESTSAQLKLTYPSIVSYIHEALSNGDYRITKDGSERIRIDSSGRLLVGATSAATSGSLAQYAKLVLRGDTGGSTSAGIINLARGAGAASMSSGNSAGNIVFSDSAGLEFGAIEFIADGTPSGSSTPGRFVVKTTASGSTTPTERLRIDSSGRVLVGSGAAATPLADDGGLDISSNNNAILIGGSGSGARANNSTKDGKIGAAHYTNTEEPVVIVRAISTSTENNLHWGGNTGTSNAATSHRFYTAANNTTTSGTERMQIDSSGNIGIGTSNPSAGSLTGTIVNISAGSNSGLRAYGGGTAVGHLYQTSDLVILGAGENSSAKLAFNTGAGLGTERMRIDNSGRLLVGTTSTSADTRAIIQARSSASDSTGRLYISSGNNAPADGDGISELYFSSSAHVASARIAAQRDGGTWTAGSSLPTRLVFSTTANGASSLTERMRIDSSGNVGIGTTSPSELLHVSGTSNPSFQLTSTNDTTPAIKWSTNSVDRLLIDSSSVVGARVMVRSNQQLSFGTNNTERMRIDSSGRVLIGTTSPGPAAGEQLTIEDSTNAGITIRSGTSSAGSILFEDDTADRGEIQYSHSNDYMRFKTAGSEAARIDSSQRVFVGLTSSVDANIGGTGYGNLFQIQGAATGEGLMVANTADFARINMVRRANVATDTQLGTISFGQSSGINPLERARISCFSETTGGTGGLGGNLRFSTSADGSYFPTERARIDNSGRLLVGRTSSTGSGEDIQDSKGGIRAIPQTSKTAAYTLVVGDVGKHVNITTGGVTIPSGVFSVGDAVSIYNDSSSDQTITQGSSVTLRLAGDGGTGNKTLAGYGLCTVLCVTSNEFVIAGTGLS